MKWGIRSLFIYHLIVLGLDCLKQVKLVNDILQHGVHLEMFNSIVLQKFENIILRVCPVLTLT